jgi:hypothetical protein
MEEHMSSEKNLTVEFETTNLTSDQIRMIRTVCTILMQVVGTDEESEFFEESAELLRKCAALITESKYGKASRDGEIPYATQAIEYSLEILQDYLSESKVVAYDN